MLAVAEAGGDDYEDADEEWIVYTAAVRPYGREEGPGRAGRAGQGRRDDHGAPPRPQPSPPTDAKKVMRLVDKLEELEDLQNVYHTMDITEEIAAALDE